MPRLRGLGLGPRALLALALTLLALLSPLDAAATSLAINPGRVVVDYEAGATKTVSFSVINSEDVKKDVSVSALGELKEQVKVREPALVLNPKETRAVDFDMFMPADLEPGTHKAEVIVRLVPPEAVDGGGSTVGATVALIFQAVVLKPYPKDYGRVTDFPASDLKLGEPADFAITFVNEGNSSLAVKGFVDIYGPDKARIAALETGEERVDSAKTVTLHASWDAGNASKGVYRAVAHVEYAGTSTEPLEREFRIGEMLVEITDFPQASAVHGSVGKISFTVKNFWNEEISDVYAAVSVLDASGNVAGTAKSESFSLDPWSEKAVTVYWDAGGAGLGTYELDAVLHYSDKTSGKRSLIVVSGSAAPAGGQDIGTVFSPGMEIAALLVAFACIVLATKALFKRRDAGRVSARLGIIENKLDALNAELSVGGGPGAGKKGGNL